MKRKIISYCLVLLMCIGMITVMNSTEAASSKPGQTSYYNERWEECIMEGYKTYTMEWYS